MARTTTDPLQTVSNLNPGYHGPVLYMLKAVCAFPSKDDACSACHYLATKKRSFESKKRYLMEMAEKHQLRYYSDEYTPPGGTRAYLQRRANLAYVNAYDRLITKRKR